ncbi:MAG: spermidine synthase, partial [Terricaulis sp.]
MQAIARRLAAPVFALALFSSAALIFVLQPLFGRMMTPLLGGSPQVWNTSMAFFQAALLAGYLYAHLLARLNDMRLQALIHGGVLIAACLFLPVHVSAMLGPPNSEQPVPWLLGVLALSVGAPFAAASATAPLLQAWYARSGRADAQDPYYLYAASNLGSFAGLLAYPTLIEPLMGAGAQSLAWATAYLAVGMVIAACALLAIAARGSAPVQADGGIAPTWRRRAYWIAAAAAPSALSLGVTLHISTDIASAPMLWVIPLALYLLTFVLAFARGGQKMAVAAQIVFPLTLSLLLLSDEMGDNWLVSASLVLLGYFFAALICHLALAASKPGAARLTEFYLCVSLGGVLGGAFAALAAPVIFNNAYEYPIALAAACLFCRAQTPRFRVADAAFGAAFAAFILALMSLAWAPPAPTLALGALGCVAAIVGTALRGDQRTLQGRYIIMA